MNDSEGQRALEHYFKEVENPLRLGEVENPLK
jgi:hypothetical protein